MANVDDIETAALQNIIHLPQVLLDRVRGWTNQGQARLEDKFDFQEMIYFWNGDATNLTGATLSVGNVALATAGGINLDSVARWGNYLHVAEIEPYYIDGASGDHVRMRWLETTQQRDLLYQGEANATPPVPDYVKIGAPEYLYEAVANDQTNPSLFNVYPASDQQNEVGDFSTAGEYQIRFSLVRRFATLTNTTKKNWVTANAADFLEYWISFRGLHFNRDYEAGNTYLALARDALNTLMRKEKRKKVQRGLAIRPRSSYYGHRFTGRI